MLNKFRQNFSMVRNHLITENIILLRPFFMFIKSFLIQKLEGDLRMNYLNKALMLPHVLFTLETPLWLTPIVIGSDLLPSLSTITKP